MRMRTGMLNCWAKESAVIPLCSQSLAYFATPASFSAALGASSTITAVPSRMTMSPPCPSPAKFNVTFGLLAMLRTRAPG